MTAQELKALRLSLNLTQSQLGERLGVTRGQIAKYEAGAKMSKSVELLANHLSMILIEP